MSVARVFVAVLTVQAMGGGAAYADTIISYGSGRSYFSYGRGYSSGYYSSQSHTYYMRGLFGRSSREPPPPVASRCSVPAFEVVNRDAGEARCASRR